MKQDDANSTPISDEALLRFLDSPPRSRGYGHSYGAPSEPLLDRDEANAGNRTSRIGESGSGTDCLSACRTATDYMRLALGTADSDTAEVLLDHAAACDACGQLLVNSLQALDGNPSAEETEAIAAFAVARPEWQKKLAVELAATSTEKRPNDRSFPLNRKWLFNIGQLGQVGQAGGGWSRWRLAAIAAAAVLVATVSLFLWQRRAANPEHQLAQAYTQARTLELRIPDAAYAASIAGGHTRGDNGDHESFALLEARARLARELERSPQDPHWLQLQARADVLEERYDSAADVLDRLLAAGPVTSELLVDAASAYFQRGLVSGSQLDRSTALDYLRRADELAPADPVVLFNEAIVMEDRGQMMNAVEVWNRYITVERDPQWVAEGRRKLAALEQTLNRLKTHESRVQRMLSSPAEMDALANDASRIAAFDEELSSMKLDQLLNAAFPAAREDGVRRTGSGLTDNDQARGSPCDATCTAARRLLTAISISLEQHHQDYWLSDLLAPQLTSQIDTLPAPTGILYSKALRLLGDAVRDDVVSDGIAGTGEAAQAQSLFEQIGASAHSLPVLAAAAETGRRRAAVEHMVALARRVDFRNCRISAEQLNRWPESPSQRERDPWIESVRMMTEKICDDTPETRQTGRVLLAHALQLAESSRYSLLKTRIEMRATTDAEVTGDAETTEKLTLDVQHELTALDPPAWRLANTFVLVCLMEQESPRSRMAESCDREAVGWAELSGNHEISALLHIFLAQAEMRIGAMQEFHRQLKMAYAEGASEARSGGSKPDFSQSELSIARSMLERSDLEDARSFLDRAAPHMNHDSDFWAGRIYAASLGQLELSLLHFDKASSLLESEIRASEGRNVRSVDKSFVAEYGAEDHDLYAELAATWLAEGRSPARVLALWERFRLRSRGLPVRPCEAQALDCEQPQLLSTQQHLGNSVLIGQIVLLDRVLVYKVDRDGVSWTQKAQQRQDLLDAAQKLERAVSSPVTTQATADLLGGGLAEVLLPPLPSSLGGDGFLLLEPDPLVENLAWPVLPVGAGSLGIAYPLTEVRSVLAPEASGDHGATHPESRESPGFPLVVAASVAGEGETPLPETLIEADKIKRYLRTPRLLLGRQATAADVAGELDSATVWHFAGHARPSGSGTELLLAAAPGETRPWIDGAFLRNHPPRKCRLAILSACATGRREAAWNHPLQDIVATLGSLGVSEIVATRWQIDSEASVPLMDNLYRNLAKGYSVPMALSIARRVQSGNSLYKNPYYWGAYYLSGRENHITQGELHASFQKENEDRPETSQAGLRR